MPLLLPKPRLTLHAKPDPLEAGEMLRHYLARVDDPLELSPGQWQFDRRLIVPAGAQVCSSWANAARLVSSATASGEGCVFELNDGVRLSGLTLDAYSLTGEGAQNQVVGFANGQQGCRAWLQDLNLVGRSFLIYVWAGQGNELDCLRVNGACGRWGVTAGGSSSPGASAQRIRLRQCNLRSDFDQYRGAGGSIGDGAVCLVARGGVIEVEGGSLTAKGSALLRENGQPYIDKVYAAWTTWQGTKQPYAGGADWPAIVFKRDADGKLPALAAIGHPGAPGADVQTVRRDIGVIEGLE